MSSSIIVYNSGLAQVATLASESLKLLLLSSGAIEKLPIEAYEAFKIDIKENEIIEFGYTPDRNLAVKFLGKQQFEVIKSEKSKLAVGDIISIYHFVLGYPLLINEVKRNNKDLGQYIAGKVSGLTYIKKVGNVY